MDGNGRWAKLQNQPRTFGHLHGVNVIPKVVEYAIEQKIEYVSFFAFSTENWNRPIDEVNYLMNLLLKNLTKKTINYLNKYNVKANWIGFEDNVDKKIISLIRQVENQTKNNTKINVNLFFNYSGIKDLDNAIKLAVKNNQEKPIKEYLLTNQLPPIDLLVRTGNEKRISNFSLYDLAYAEIIFEPTLWPEYSKETFNKNINDYFDRDRRFGKI